MQKNLFGRILAYGVQSTRQIPVEQGNLLNQDNT